MAEVRTVTMTPTGTDMEIARELVGMALVGLRVLHGADLSRCDDPSIDLSEEIRLLKAAATRLEGLRNNVIEECAKVADDYDSARLGHSNEVAVKFFHYGESEARREIAASIRALTPLEDPHTEDGISTPGGLK